MNEAVLSERLRSLREPAPRNGFDERLQQALWREAGELRAERTRGDAASLRRARRWGGRLGLGVIIACGATAAAAAAGGIWAAVAYSQRSASEAAVPPAAPEGTGAQLRSAVPTAPAAAPSAEESPSGAESPSAAPAVVAPPTPEPAGAAVRAADAKPAASAREKSRGGANLESATHDRSPPSAPAALVPFELPSRASAERANAAGPGTAPPSRLERLQLPEPGGAAANREARGMPGLAVRPDRRSRPDNSASDRGAAPPGLEIARERASEKAERGQERAREARERK